MKTREDITDWILAGVDLHQEMRKKTNGDLATLLEEEVIYGEEIFTRRAALLVTVTERLRRNDPVHMEHIAYLADKLLDCLNEFIAGPAACAEVVQALESALDDAGLLGPEHDQ